MVQALEELQELQVTLVIVIVKVLSSYLYFYWKCPGKTAKATLSAYI